MKKRLVNRVDIIIKKWDKRYKKWRGYDSFWINTLYLMPSSEGNAHSFCILPADSSFTDLNLNFKIFLSCRHVTCTHLDTFVNLAFCSNQHQTTLINNALYKIIMHLYFSLMYCIYYFITTTLLLHTSFGSQIQKKIINLLVMFH